MSSAGNDVQVSILPGASPECHFPASLHAQSSDGMVPGHCVCHQHWSLLIVLCTGLPLPCRRCYTQWRIPVA